MFKINKKGFTLIELLVVIAIIGLLSTLAVVALGSARLKSRDAKRLSDLKQLSTALELYNTDNAIYPVASNLTLGTGSAVCLNTTGFHTTGCANAYMGQVPADPNGGTYVYNSTGTTFTINATLEGTISGFSGAVKRTPAGLAPGP